MAGSILIYLTIYAILAFGITRFIIPHLGSGDVRIPEKLPSGMDEIISKMKEKAENGAQFLELAYDYLGSRYRSERFNTFFKFHYLFLPLEKVWASPGFMPCTQTNFLLRIFLVKSGFFKDEDIRRKHIPVNFVPHQYLVVRVDGKWINADAGEKQRGMKLGEYLKWFG